ncbi:MAG: Na-translocating system protein MpsB [Proteobacteria bacterium]|nr:Na-translocating system protein MpsB [Pseudomonadota bacterium]
MAHAHGDKEGKELTPHERLHGEIEHIGHYLPSQLPITTFVHHNTLHAFENWSSEGIPASHMHGKGDEAGLSFEESIITGARINGAKPFMPNTRFRQWYAEGRITDEDLLEAVEYREDLPVKGTLAKIGEREIDAQEVQLTHLVRGIDPIDPDQLPYIMAHGKGSSQFRADVPGKVRKALLDSAAKELTAGLERVGRDWTLAHWVQAHTSVDAPGWLREKVKRDLDPIARPRRRASDTAAKYGTYQGELEPWFSAMAVPLDRREGYLAIIDRVFHDEPIRDLVRPETIRQRWLQAEARLLRKLVPRHFGVYGTVSALARHFSDNLEAYAVNSLYQAALAAYGASDPFSPTHPQHLYEQDVVGADVEALDTMAQLEYRGGVPVALSPELRQSVDRLIDREQERRLEADEVGETKGARLARLVAENLGPDRIGRDGFEPLMELVALRRSEADNAELQGKLRAADTRRQILDYAEELVGKEINKIGLEEGHLHDSCTHTHFLQTLTGVDLGHQINQYLMLMAGAYLDHGMAAWHWPAREQGLWKSWKRNFEDDKTLSYWGIEGWKEELLRLPELPEDVILESLEALGVPEERMGSFLGWTSRKLPGWAGMMNWRGERPEHYMQKHFPASLLDFLAIRLFVERVVVADFCRKLWKIDGTIASLRRYCEKHPAEFLVRKLYFQGALPEYLADRARTLVADAPVSGPQDDRWLSVAELAWLHRNGKLAGTAAGHTLNNKVMRLFYLGQHLGLSGEQIRSLSLSERDALIDCLEAYPPDKHGFVWLTAFENHYRHEILGPLVLNRNRARWEKRVVRPKFQTVFCIDEREEGIRRQLEEIDPDVETLGGAGFYAMAMHWEGTGGHGTDPLCPIVQTPVNTIKEVAYPNLDLIPDDMKEGSAEVRAMPMFSDLVPVVQTAVREGNSDRIMEKHTSALHWLHVMHDLYWESKRNLVSSYFLLDLMGLPIIGQLYLAVFGPRLSKKVDNVFARALIPPKLSDQTLDAPSGTEDACKAGHQFGYTPEQQAFRLGFILKQLGLLDVFSKIVVIHGHGSSSYNNPFESAYSCGACGGKDGAPNARAMAALANKPNIRAALAKENIVIPDDTWFVGACHDTCNEAIDYLDVERIPPERREDFLEAVRVLDLARTMSAHERCRRFPFSPKDSTPERSLRHVESRSTDFAMSVPELGHATNACAFVGRRCHTRGIFYDRRMFLISYDPTFDREGAVLEKILFAVGPVGAGINLEYYHSTVDNKVYGCDTKIPQNVAGILGVMEGVMSDLRTGLPFQMVNIHEAQRLQLIIEHTEEALLGIATRQPIIMTLVAKQWLHLTALNPDTKQLSVFSVKDGGFVPYTREPNPIPTVTRSMDWYRGKYCCYVPPALIDLGDEKHPSAGINLAQAQQS